MIRKLLSLLLIITASQAVDAKENYIAYHKQILQCEDIFLTKNDVGAALKAYKQVFAHYSRPFAKDCFIALQLACYTNDKKQLDYFFRLAFERGINMEAISSAACISHLLDADTVYKKKIVALYAKAHATFMAKLNMDFRNKLIAMKQFDDKMKMSIKGGYATRLHDSTYEVYMKVLDSNTSMLTALVRQYGFPGDDIVGFLDYGLGGTERERIDICYQLYSLADQLFFHDACGYFMLEDMMKDAINSGDILPASYACIYEWAHKDLKEGRRQIEICRPVNKLQTAYYNICPVVQPWNRQADTALVNKCRAEIGMGSTSHFARKREFEKATGLKLLFGSFELY